MIGMMDKGGAQSVQPQMGGLGSMFANNTPMPVQSAPTITQPTLPMQQPSMPSKGGAGIQPSAPSWSSILPTPQQAAAATAARIGARTPVLVVEDPTKQPEQKPERVSRHMR